MMTVRYQTAYDLYEITSKKTASEMTFCVYMENTAYIITGIEGGSETTPRAKHMRPCNGSQTGGGIPAHRSGKDNTPDHSQ